MTNIEKLAETGQMALFVEMRKGDNKVFCERFGIPIDADESYDLERWLMSDAHDNGDNTEPEPFFDIDDISGTDIGYLIDTLSAADCDEEHCPFGMLCRDPDNAGTFCRAKAPWQGKRPDHATLPDGCVAEQAALAIKLMSDRLKAESKAKAVTSAYMNSYKQSKSDPPEPEDFGHPANLFVAIKAVRKDIGADDARMFMEHVREIEKALPELESVILDLRYMSRLTLESAAEMMSMTDIEAYKIERSMLDRVADGYIARRDATIEARREKRKP